MAQDNTASQLDSIVISKSEIEAFQVQSIQDVLNLSSGVSVGTSSISINGSTSVKVFLDGRSINDPSSSSGGVEWELVTLEQVERIEIFRGKGAIKYGQDASAGVVLINTNTSDILSGNINTYVGDYESANTRMNLQTSIGLLSTGLSAGYETTEGFRANDDEENYRLGIQIGYQSPKKNNKKPNKSINFTSDLIDESSGSPGYIDSPTLFYRKENTLSITAISAQYNNIHSISSLTKSDNRNTDITRNLNQKLSISEFKQTVSSSFTSKSIGDYSLGVSYYDGKASSSDFSSQNEYTWSGFSTISLPKSWFFFDLNAGLRLNYSSAFDYSLNPEINISYPNDNFGVSFSYSGNNNIPSFKKRFNQTSYTIPNASLAMETADNFSITVTNKWENGISSSVNLYYNILTDRITYVREGGIGQYQNFGEVTYTGLNLSSSWKASDKLVIKYDYNYLEAIDEETDYWLTSKSRHTSNVIFQYRPNETLSLNLTIKNRSKSYINKTNTKAQESYTLVDLQVEYAIDNIRLFGNLDNMFDKFYTFSGGFPSPSRYWELGIQYNF